MKTRICFIVNPVSGVGRQQLIEQKIERWLDLEQYAPTVWYTEMAGHAKTLSTKAVTEGFPIVVAVGGDGSINEVMSGLVGTEVILGIVPSGSGNGLSMHLGIGRDIDQSLQILNKRHTMVMDTGLINETPFINLAGVGFDAHVAYHMKRSKYRGLKAYLWQTILHVWQYPFQKVKIKIDDQIMELECLVVEVANAPMFGYNFLIAPQAKLNDGILDVVIIKKAPKWRYLFSAWRFLNGSILRSRLTEHFTGRRVEISSTKEMAVHYDGEGFLSNEELVFCLRPLSLRVIIPRL